MVDRLWTLAKVVMGFQLTLKISENGSRICKGARVQSQVIMTTVDWNGFDSNQMSQTSECRNGHEH